MTEQAGPVYERVSKERQQSVMQWLKKNLFHHACMAAQQISAGQDRYRWSGAGWQTTVRTSAAEQIVRWHV